jgi:hypothetical protein
MFESKTCFKCGTAKELSEFYRHPYMADGHLGKCKSCTKKDVMEHREKNIDSVRAYDRERGKLPHRRAQLLSLAHRQDAERKVKASIAVNNAVRFGKLKKQLCHVCGATKVDAHHTHYSHYLEVVWLCRSHHTQLHRQFSLWMKEKK